jgi:hypothetical protein
MTHYLRFPRRRRYLEDYDDEEDIVERPRTSRRRRRKQVTPYLDEVLHWMKSQVRALEDHQKEQQEKYKTKPPTHKLPYPTGLALTFFAAPFVWGIFLFIFYGMAKSIILGQ